MGIENEDFIDFRFKQEFIDEDDIVYFSGDEIEGPISPHHFEIGLFEADFTVEDYDFEDDENDEEYNPADDDAFLSDSDILNESDDSQSGLEQAYFSDSNNEDVEVTDSSESAQANSKETEENKAVTTRSTQAPTSSSAPPSTASDA